VFYFYFYFIYQLKCYPQNEKLKFMAFLKKLQQLELWHRYFGDPLRWLHSYVKNEAAYIELLCLFL
jgi:hypothetical protein